MPSFLSFTNILEQAVSLELQSSSVEKDEVSALNPDLPSAPPSNPAVKKNLTFDNSDTTPRAEDSLSKSLSIDSTKLQETPSILQFEPADTDTNFFPDSQDAETSFFDHIGNDSELFSPAQNSDAFSLDRTALLPDSNVHETSLFGDEDDDSSFLSSIGHTKSVHIDSNQSDVLKIATAPKPNADSFEKVFEEKNKDITSGLRPTTTSSHVRGQSTAFLFSGNDGAEDSFFQDLGITKAKDNNEFLVSLVEKSNEEHSKHSDGDSFGDLLKQDLVATTEEPLQKPDLAKSFAFLDDDELLPDDYVETSKTRSSSVVPHSVQTAKAATSTTLPLPHQDMPYASNTSSQSAPYSKYSSFLQQPSLPKVPPKGPAGNAFDLPTDMVPKTVKRMASFQSVQQTFSFGAGPGFVPPKPSPSLSSKSFFEELPPIPRKTTSRKTSTISLHQQQPPSSTSTYGSQSNFSNHSMSHAMGHPTGLPTGSLVGQAHSDMAGPPVAPLHVQTAPPSRNYSITSAGTGAEFLPQHTTNLPGGALKSQYSNPYEVQSNSTQGTSRTSTPYNSYDPPVNPYSPQTQPSAQQQVQNPYAPLPSAANNAASRSSSTSYPRGSSGLGLQPATPVDGGAFTDLPVDLGPRASSYANVTPEVQPAALHNYSQQSPGTDYGYIPHQVHASPPVARSSYSTGSVEKSPKKVPPQTPINNEALLRRQFPIFNWGLSGTTVTVIPSAISFGGGATIPEIKIVPASQIIRTTDQDLNKFPFSIVTSKGSQRGKKKELETWIEEHVKQREATLKTIRPEDSSRLSDRVALWKVMLALLQADSTTKKPSKNLMDAIRKILDPFVQVESSEELATFAPAVDIYQRNLHRRTSSLGNGTSRGLKTEDINRLVDLLKVGQRENALKYALDQHLWAHALIVASSVGPSHWIDTVFEFVREEIRVFPSQSARDLALMYRTFSGAGADSGKFACFLDSIILTLV